MLPWNPAWPENRLGLAQWLFDSKNPLTSRVFVNRAWQSHFGRGLVETSEDFGSQGSLPTNPELLDYLAVTFRESGWDIKKLHKLIVMSGTYRQQSDANEETAAEGSEQPAAGAVHAPADAGGDGARPGAGRQRPAGEEDRRAQRLSVSAAEHVGRLQRRTTIRRQTRCRPTLTIAGARCTRSSSATRRIPNMATFDLPDRGGATARRRTSNSPLQALVLLDDPQFLEAYRALAGSVLKTETETRMRG